MYQNICNGTQRQDTVEQQFLSSPIDGAIGTVSINTFSIGLGVLVFPLKLCLFVCSMKTQSWLRRNWMWAAGGAFLTIHLATWLMQRAMKSVARSETALRQKASEDKLD